MLAVNNRKEEIIEILLSKGADAMIKNQYDSGDSALHYACDGGDTTIALMIISNSTDLNLRNYEGMTPLMYAVQKKHLKLAETLISMGADPFVTDKCSLSAIDWAFKVGIPEPQVRVLGKESLDLDHFENRSYKKKNHSESFVTSSDRSLYTDEQDPTYKPGLIADGIGKGIDLLINQVTWSK
jgi:ankyrin repeat protein